jgi:DNA polymerase alpha subunit A
MSWCKSEFVVESRKLVSVLEEQPASPPLLAMSLNLKTVVDPKTKHHSIVMISWLIHRNGRSLPRDFFSFLLVSMDAETVGVDKLERFTVARKLPGIPWPFDLAQTLKGAGLEASVKLCDGERELLSFFFALVGKLDPDVLIGHNISAFDMDLLFSRAEEFKILGSFSRIGRLERKK